MEIKNDILWRVYLCFLLIAVLGLCVLGRAVYIQQAQGKFWEKMSDSLHLVYKDIQAERGSIYSEDGYMLSTSVPIFDVFVDFGADGLREKDGKRFKDNVDSLSISLAGLFKDKTADDYKKELQLAYKNEERYYTLKKKISFDEMNEMKSFPLVRLGRNKSGFMIEARDRRINPYVLFANRTIGISRPDTNKNVGLERTYNTLLQGTKGQKLMRYAAGVYIPVDGAEVDPVNGKDIVTTIDTYMQDIAQNALMDMMVGNNSKHGTAIVMETATGKIKAIANLGQQPDGTYIEDLNYGIGKATEPGSIFKLATLLSLLDDGYVNNSSIVNCEGGRKYFYGLKIQDSHLGAGDLTVKEAFERSSNVAFAKLANQYYGDNPSKFIAHLHKFRLDTLTGVDIVASSGKPTIKKPTNRSWGKTTIPFMAHGYEELVTPLHMLTFYNAVANGGKLMRPYLVSAIKEYGVTVKTVEPEVLVDKIAGDAAISQAIECMRGVVDGEHGTAHKVMYDSIYSIAGKTGTAVTALDNRGYNKGNKIYQASFIGFFPAERPKYTVAVVIQNTRESKKIYGADVSGVVFKNIADKIFARYISKQSLEKKLQADTALYANYGSKNDFQSIFKFMNIGFTDSSASGYWRSSNLKNNTGAMQRPAQIEVAKNLVPNVAGMGLKDAVYLLENKGLKVAVIGQGKVMNQSIAAGSSFNKGQKISLMLN